MKERCVTAVQAAAKALGRNPLTKAQLASIDNRMSATLRQFARTDPEWQSKSMDQRVSKAAQQAMADIQAGAARKLENAQRQIVKTAATEARITEVGKDGRRADLVEDLHRTQAYINGIKQEAIGNMVNLMDAAKTGEGAGFGRRVMMFLFDADNPGMTRDLATEIYQNADGKTGNKVATEGAKAYLQVIESLRQRFNAAGGDVGRLEYGYIPQPHDAGKVRGAGGEPAREAWVAKIMPLLDRSRYVLEDGARMGDAELQGVLGRAWETIGSDGANKREPGVFGGTGAKANAGSESRQIHFKDADSYMAYMKDFGTGSMYDAVIGHVGRMARDIGLIERYGPNPNAQMRLQFDLATKADPVPDKMRSQIAEDLTGPEATWRVVSGASGMAKHAQLAQISTDVRNLQTMGKLGSAVISSITDLGTFVTTTGYNKLSYWDAFKNVGKSAASKDTRDFMTAHGIIAESMIGDMNRWTGDNIRQTWSGRLANSTMKLSLMNAWTDTLRRAFSLTMMQGMARMSKTEWGKLTEWDRTLMERRGITADDWAVVSKAQLTEHSGMQHLTPEAIRATGDARADEVVAKVLGLITDESEFAVLNPDLTTKKLASLGGQARGTIVGELARSMAQFKSFPIAMVSRHWRRVLDAPQVGDGSAPALTNRLMYAGALMVSTTALGAMSLQGKQIRDGKDPIDMFGPHAWKFWAKAVAQGGGLSIAGDFLLNDPADSQGGFLANAAKTALGPSFGTGAEVLGILIENTHKSINDKDTHTGAQAVRILRSNAPYVNLWYAKSALDHAGMHALQENLSPGYLGKMKQRAAKDFGQSYWWQPGTGGPDRAPDLSKAAGQ